MTRRYVIFAPGAFAERAAKTAHGVIAYSRDVVVAVVDPDHAGRRVRDVVPYLRSDAPIVATVRESLRFEPTALLIGIAPPGGALPPEYRAEIAVALQSRLEVVNGLHAFLNDDAEMRALADKHDSRIWDLRLPPAAPLFSGAAYDIAEPRRADGRQRLRGREDDCRARAHARRAVGRSGGRNSCRRDRPASRSPVGARQSIA